MISGINHITLSIRDVAESLHFYVDILGCRPLARWPKGAYLLAGDVWLALVLDADRLRSGPLPEYSHIAFSVSPGDFGALSDKICQAGAPIWQEDHSEGQSLYFLDPNGHKLEIHATDLAARMRAARAEPWDGLEFLDPTW